jgi:hypothetical protein
MFTCTNLAWPDDPYRTGQQLYRRPSPMLAAFTVLSAWQDAVTVTAPAAIAVGYLPLHRTRAIEVTEDTVSFGFRAASTAGDGGVRDLARSADLDLMQARRHARLLAGHALAGGLHALREAEPGRAARGLAAVEAAWADRRSRRRGTAAMIDISDGRHDLAAICRSAAISASPASMARDFACPTEPGAAEQLAAAAAEQALVIALACARALDRYRWEGTLRTARVMTATAWDLFPHATWDHTRREQPAS